MIARPGSGLGATPFLEGYHIGRNSHDSGWPIDEPPTENSIVEFIGLASGILCDQSLGSDSVPWIGGLLKGWLDRPKKP